MRVIILCTPCHVVGRKHVETGAVLEGSEQYGDVGSVFDALRPEIFSNGSRAVPEP